MSVLVKIYIKMFIKYPINLFLKLIYLPFQMLMYYILWHSIDSHRYFDKEYILYYYLFSILLTYAFPFLHIPKEMEEDVMEGRILNYLIRPYPYILRVIAKYVAWLICYSVIFIPFIFIVIFIKGVTIGGILSFLTLFIIGSILEFLIWYNVGLFSLKREVIRGVMTFVLAFRLIASGGLLPLNLYPEKIKVILECFPFRVYIFNSVNSLLIGYESIEFLRIIGFSLFWIILLAISIIYRYRKNLEKIQVNQA